MGAIAPPSLLGRQSGIDFDLHFRAPGKVGANQFGALVQVMGQPFFSIEPNADNDAVKQGQSPIDDGFMAYGERIKRTGKKG